MRVIRWKNSLNYSVGYRAPNARELFSGFADYVLQRELGSQRYADPDVPSRDHPADIFTDRTRPPARDDAGSD
ncbi:putative enzyme [Klebsiella pneumoniae]|uniref:Putative enzyme n=1 Tax=Klebsiella pneumoniae TaxID=573 RepID=A0A377WGR5_KLEPN|nr:putative enzyme [Klebsiella pneumoniae]